MTLLILGLALWSAAHFFKPAMPAQRTALTAKLGEGRSKGLIAVLILASVVMMVIGYQQAEATGVWYPPSFMVHINNLLMLIAIALFGAAHSKGNAKRYVRHPMLLSVIVWAAAHLIVNGDLASAILFGGMLIWAVASIILINSRKEAWVKPAPAHRKKDFILLAITLVVFGAVVGLHMLAGVSPFPG